jgi:hypothetical protein
VREQRQFGAQVAADDEQPGEAVHRRERQAKTRHREPRGIAAEIALTQAMVEVGGPEAAHDARCEVQFLEGERGVREQARRGPRRRQPTGGRAERGLPVDLAPLAALAQARLCQAVGGEQAFVAEALAVGDPGLVDVVVGARHDALEAAAQHMAEEIGAEAVVRRDQRRLRHLPRAPLVAEGLAVERTHRAEVDDVAGELVLDGFLDVGADLHVLAATGGAEFRDAGDVLAEAHATRAVDAARHVGGDERTQVFVLDHALALVEARDVTAEAEREVLQLALAALIADRAVERVVDEQELHRRLLGADGDRRFGEDLHALGDRRRAGGQGLRRLFDLDEAHAAVGRDRQLVVVTETRHIRAVRVGGVDDHRALAGLDGLAVDLEVDEVVLRLRCHGVRHAALRPRPSPSRRCCVRGAGSCTRIRGGSV